jgi:molybdate transport system ATP-binding protein
VLQLNVARRQGGLELDLALGVAAGDTLALVGESGAGKTTVLRLVAGLLSPDQGRIEVGGETWTDTDARIALPAERRSVGYVQQDYALFPHLSVARNIAFGLEAEGVGRGELRRRTGLALERFGLLELARRRPADLSGGQQQRVALARALVLEPAVLLLDEPMSALDVATRRTVRGELRAILATLPCATIYVTHNPIEALVFGDRIAVLERGRLTQVGGGDELVARPRSPYVAEFVGVNLLRGTVESDGESGGARFRFEGGALTMAGPVEEGPGFVVVSPRDIVLSREPPAGSARNVVRGRVREVVPEPPLGERVRVVLDAEPALVAEVTPAAVASLELRPGELVYAAFKATGVTPYR